MGYLKNMQEKQYEVACNRCGGTTEVTLVTTKMGKLIKWDRIGKIISGRERLDNQLGWQCVCGNNNLMTEQELKQIDNWAQPTPQELSRIIKNLIPEKQNQFNLREL